MLTEEKKRQIEEKVEAKKYKQKLESNKSFVYSIWAFFNTNFGLWLISAVFVSSITTYLTKLNLELKEENLEKERNYKLLSEFGGRYSRLYYFTNDSETATGDRVRYNADDFAILLFPTSDQRNISMLYPEFNNYNLMSIAFQLEQAVKIDSLKNLFRDFRHDLYRLERIFSRININDSSKAAYWGNKATDFRVKWGDLLYQFNFFGDFDTYLGYKPDFDRSKFDELFGYKVNKYSWIYFLLSISLLLMAAYLIFYFKRNANVKHSSR